MKTRLILLLTTITLLFIIVGCSSDNKSGTDSTSKNLDNNQDLEENDEGNDIITEKDLLESLLEEANKYTHVMLKDESFSIGIDKFGNYELRQHNDNIQDLRLSETKVEIEFVQNEEDYELSNGMKGIIGDTGGGYISFVHYDNDMRTVIDLGEIQIEDAKKKLDSLEFRNEDITENEIKELLGFDYEDAKFFDNKETDYDVSELWINTGDYKKFEVRYRNPDAGEFDAIDIRINVEEFEVDDYVEPENITTNKGKKVEIIDDGFYAHWLWEEDDYFYQIAGNYSEEEVEKKEYNLEVIDKMTKKYGE